MKDSLNLWDLLRCPSTGQTLSAADAALLAKVNLQTAALRSGRNKDLPGSDDSGRTAEVTAALVRADRKVVYPIRGGIPVLLESSAIPL